MDTINETAIGLFLKTEREKKGLTVDYMAKVTRLRKYYIEALENEDWDKLPSRVFIKGFLRTYSKGLGLNYDEVIGRFESSVPVHDGLPKPLLPPSKNNKKYVFLFVALGIIALCLFIVIFMKNTGSNVTKPGGAAAKVTENKNAQSPDNHKDVAQAPSLNQSSTLKNNLPSVNNPVAVRGHESSPAESIIKASVPGAPSQEPLTGSRAAETIQTAPVKSIQTAVHEAVKKTDEQSFEAAMKQYSLTGLVTATTYVKIYIDSNPPKDYIFPKGSRPHWNASEGFYVLVGNAGGIEFDFNGKRIKDLGNPGAVVRLRLPENSNLNISEN
jgi:cytoskeleton protein RodZ